MAANPFLKRRKCANPQCLNKDFQPRRRDQKFCSSICKDYYHNELKRNKNLNDYYLEKVLKQNERKLARIYASGLYPNHVVDEALLAYEEVVVAVHTETNINAKTNRLILWSHKYGLEHTGSVPRRYIIHKR